MEMTTQQGTALEIELVEGEVEASGKMRRKCMIHRVEGLLFVDFQDKE